MKFSTEELLERLESQKINNSPSLKDVETPNYPLYAFAPYWFPHQVICLMTGLAVIDHYTLQTVLALSNLQLLINQGACHAGSKINDLRGNKDFHEFLIMSFPIPHKKLNYLKNVKQRLEESIKDGSLTHCQVEKEILLKPEDVVVWAKKQQISIPEKLIEAMTHKGEIDPLYLPKTFKDEINIYGKWTALRIEHNLSKPLACIETSSMFSEETNLSKSAPLMELTERAQKLHNQVLNTRKQTVLLALDMLFKGEEKTKKLGLIETIGSPEKEEFEVYNQAGPIPPLLEVSHRCRVLGKLLKEADNTLKIRDLIDHHVMETLGWRQEDKTPLETFRKWMHKEGIFDRQPSKSR